MADVVEFTENGRTYEVTGLQAKAQSVNAAAQEMDTMIGDRIDAAEAAMKEWRGKHVAIFGEDVNDVLSKMATFRLKLGSASRVLSYFPDEPTASPGLMQYTDSIYMSARIEVPPDDGTASATPGDLRSYTETSSGQDSRYNGLANVVNLDGVTATVSYHRSLTPAERQRRIDGGMPPEEADRGTAIETETVPQSVLETLIPLPSPRPQIEPLRTASQDVGEFASAVATAFEEADDGLLDLLADYPDLAGFVVTGMGDGRVSGESSLAILLAYFDDFDTAGHGGDPDGEVSMDDIEAIIDNPDMPDYVREAAEYLSENPTLFGLAETMNDDRGADGEHVVGDGDERISQDDIEKFLEFNGHLRTLQENFDDFDTAHEGGEPDGNVSRDDLEAMADSNSEFAEAAQYLLDNDLPYQRLANYQQAKEINPVYAGQYPQFDISIESVIGLTVDQQIYGDDPEAAHQFVQTLPEAMNGSEGLDIRLCSDDGTKALANSALTDTLGDLTDTHSVIAHLPETTTGVRNQLITGFYDELARRADVIFAGEDLAGAPHLPGHPGLNWTFNAPWASNSAGVVIRGDFSALGFSANQGERQAMADGNQWIFNDVGARYADFIEMYESNPNPTDSELESFFNNSFEDGSREIQTGFAAYVAAIQETDPRRRQELLFEGNTLVAMHEQAGVQPYLEELDRWYVPRAIERRYSDLNIDGQRYDLDMNVPEVNGPNNYIDDANILDLDPTGRDPSSYLPTGVDVSDIEGIQSWDDDFATSTRTWSEEGGGGNDPDSLEGTDASSWQNRNERMWYILKLFEQNHSNPALTHTSDRNLQLGQIEWLDEGLR